MLTQNGYQIKYTPSSTIFWRDVVVNESEFATHQHN